MGSLAGVILAHARRLGISVEEYKSRRASGLKYCWRCRSWRNISEFSVDRSRYDSLAAVCRRCLRVGPRQLPLLRETPAEYERRRYATDPLFRSRRSQRASARKRGVDVVPPEGVEALTEFFGGRCAYCPKPATTWDHIVPVSRGGRTIPGNMVPACKSCNSRKKDLDVNDFIEKYNVYLSEELDSMLALACEWGQL